jgi:hypothetical protein
MGEGTLVTTPANPSEDLRRHPSGWWLASDGNWYRSETQPDASAEVDPREWSPPVIASRSHLPGASPTGSSEGMSGGAPTPRREHPNRMTDLMSTHDVSLVGRPSPGSEGVRPARKAHR